MIARIWHGMTLASRGDEYWAFLNERAIPDFQNTAGNVGAYILRRIEGDRAHFLTISLWESAEVIRNFAGEVLPRGQRLLA